jgi:hypothetical protein
LGFFYAFRYRFDMRVAEIGCGEMIDAERFSWQPFRLQTSFSKQLLLDGNRPTPGSFDPIEVFTTATDATMVSAATSQLFSS